MCFALFSEWCKESWREQKKKNNKLTHFHAGCKFSDFKHKEIKNCSNQKSRERERERESKQQQKKLSSETTFVTSHMIQEKSVF